MLNPIGLTSTKNPLFLPLLVILLLTGWGCRRDHGSGDESSRVVYSPARRAALLSNIDHLRVRETPGPDGKIIATLSEGDTLFDLGEVSAFTTEVTLRGIRFNEPWIKVRTRDSLVGWVYAGGVNFQMDEGDGLTSRLMEIRLKTFFGDSLAKGILGYRPEFQKAGTSAALAGVYRKAQALRDTLVRVFDQRITLIQSPEQIPNLAWMKEALPGMVPQRVAEGTAFYLFMDYPAWLEKSRRTTGAADNQFFDVCITAYALDSIEYFIPDWNIAVSDETVYSELGKGVHLKMLEKMNAAMAADRLFEPEYRHFKSALLDDIAGLKLSYWNDREAILRELDAILAADFGMLTPVEKAGIEARRKQFENPAENGIRLNFRAGI